MKLMKILQNPFTLGFQGFLVGTILVFSPSPFAAADAAADAAPGAAIAAPASTEG